MFVKERRQQIDIPEPKIIVTEYWLMQVRCQCGLLHNSTFPEGFTPNVSYGARLKAYSVGLGTHLRNHQRHQYGIQPFAGSVQKWIVQAANHLLPDYLANQRALINADVAHFDESGFRKNGKLHWLHVAATASHVHYYSVHDAASWQWMRLATCPTSQALPSTTTGNPTGITPASTPFATPITCANSATANNSQAMIGRLRFNYRQKSRC